MSYDEQVAQLAELETFDAAAFEGTDEVPQPVCNLVLALAVAYNDLRDVLFANFLLQERGPVDMSQPSKEAGQYGGLLTSITRVEAAVLHEILVLLDAEKKVRKHVFFHEVVRSMPRTARDAWAEMEAVADGERVYSDFARSLLMIRNKVASHYDPKQIKLGLALYRKSASPEPDLFVSRGSSMQSTRFYFADAAAIAYMRNSAAGPDIELFQRQRSSLTKAVNLALHELVTHFVARRGFAWRQWLPT